MVQIRGLQKSYKNHKVLRGLNMNIERGDCYGFIGKNGCGKTTTMNIVCNILSKDGGEVILGDDASANQKIKIGYLPESPALFGYLSGAEYLAYIAACAKYEDERARTAEVLQIVGLNQDAANRKVRGYSRGMNQRLGIAAAMYDRPDLLILDEPTSALDPEGRSDVMDIIKNLTGKGTTILLCTHILSDVERVANRVGILTDGVIAIEGRIDDVLKRDVAPTEVRVKFSEPQPAYFAALRELPEVRSSFIDGQTGVLTLVGADARTLCAVVMRALSEKNIVPESLSIQRPTLEETYLKAIGSVTNN